ncbi:MAG: hypothetical protein L0Y72_27125 [Gemmataceae bacterium]|nr:hypothetical protein [Gemmataceae bacterium]MCI0742724.1 hypothetical protein [Gemmataceae bacterium]
MPTSPAIPVRPKPRRKRRRILLIFALLITALAGYFLYSFLAAGWELDAALAETDRLDPGWRMLTPHVPLPDANNSALQILAVDKRLGGFAWWKRWPEGPDALFRNLSPQAPLPNKTEAALRAALLADLVAVKEARKLKDMPAGVFPAPKGPPPYLSFHFEGEWARVVFLLYGDALLRLTDENADAALESCLAYGHAVLAVKGDPAPVCYILRWGRSREWCRAIEWVLAHGEASTERLQPLQALLQRQIEGPSLEEMVRALRFDVHHMMEAFAEGRVDAAELSLFGDNSLGKLEIGIADTIRGSVKSSHAALIRHYTRLVEAMKLPEEERQQALAAIESARQDLPRLAQALALRPGNLLLQDQGMRAYLASTHVGLAAERFRLERGHWPETLAALVDSKHLAKVPLDPYDGKTLRWKKLADGVMVYSVGPDGNDDGGQLDRTDQNRAGMDIGMQLWNPDARRRNN